MRIQCQWKDGMLFSGSNGTHTVSMDGKRPFGTESAMSPKELLVVGLCGCTAMDVVGLLKKHKQKIDFFEVEAQVTSSTDGHPVVFSNIHLTFKLTGAIDPPVLLESIHLSQSKYCGISAMLSQAVAIHYSVVLNQKEIGTGEAQFP